MTDRMPWPLAPVGILDGNTHNAIAIGPEASGKTSLFNTIAARLVGIAGHQAPLPIYRVIRAIAKSHSVSGVPAGTSLDPLPVTGDTFVKLPSPSPTLPPAGCSGVGELVQALAEAFH